MDGPVLSYMHVIARAELVPLLTNENFACNDVLVAKALYAAALRLGVSAVTGGATGFLVCHSRGILQKEEGVASGILGVLGVFQGLCVPFSIIDIIYHIFYFFALMSLEQQSFEENQERSPNAWGPVMNRRAFFRTCLQGNFPTPPVLPSDLPGQLAAIDHSYLETVGEASLLLLGNLILTKILKSAGILNGNKSIDPSDITFMNTVVIAPLLEELVFRLPASVVIDVKEGVDSSGSSEVHWEVGIPNALMFALVHSIKDGKFIAGVPVQQFLAGVYLWYTMREKGFDHAVLAHSTYNGLGFALIKMFPKG